MLKNSLLSIAGAAALLVPAAASAQGYYGQGYNRYGDGYDRGYERGGDYRPSRAFPGYPEFRGLEEHIRAEIRDSLRQDLIERDDARDLFQQLRDIQAQEAREFRVHGWNLPNDDRYRIRTRLEQLDRLVDQIREEPED